MFDRHWWAIKSEARGLGDKVSAARGGNKEVDTEAKKPISKSFLRTAKLKEESVYHSNAGLNYMRCLSGHVRGGWRCRGGGGSAELTEQWSNSVRREVTKTFLSQTGAYRQAHAADVGGIQFVWNWGINKNIFRFVFLLMYLLLYYLLCVFLRDLFLLCCRIFVNYVSLVFLIFCHKKTFYLLLLKVSRISIFKL